MTRFPTAERTPVSRANSNAGAATAEPPHHLLEHELAQRWRLSVRTLQRWRRAGQGPAFLRLGRRIAYRLADIEDFEETAQVRSGAGS